MSEDYRQMWKNLGLDLEAHDALLNVLGQGYQQVVLTQKNRPEALGNNDKWRGFLASILTFWR